MHESASGITQVIRRPSNPDCVVFSHADDGLALTSYYRQTGVSSWTGGVGVHRLADRDGGLCEMEFEFYSLGGVFDMKLRENDGSGVLVSATVDKSLLVHSLETDDSHKTTLKLLHKTDLEKSAVYVDMK